ncbi:hypothetical protein [Rhizobium sp. BK251]|uniref:hypothetical protein n=1 Tax=Rhizobium sp. BK251 TaxID=2512125 RepID=UPI0010536726|nr:hypothetical protein [Rhizobium sp. BK251]TCL71874.1 hypothetical protein EV286_105130 [Rhizobium sp. BK251]
MLSPVRSSSSADMSFQPQAALISAKGIGQAPAGAEIATRLMSPDLSSAIAARLNALLVASRQRMIDSLLDAIETAGRVIGLRRDDGETDIVYAARVAEAVRSLPPARMAAAERLMRAEGQPLSLGTVAAAVLSPEGPEAAQAMAHIETANSRDRDLAARAVVRSYRQNEGSPLRPAEPVRQSPVTPRQEPASETHQLAPAAEEASPSSAPRAERSINAEPQRPASLEKTDTVPHLVRIEPAALPASKTLPREAASAPFTHRPAEQAPSPLNERPAAAAVPRGWVAILGTVMEAASEFVKTTLLAEHAIPVEPDAPAPAATAQGPEAGDVEPADSKPQTAAGSSAGLPADRQNAAIETDDATARVSARNPAENANRLPPPSENAEIRSRMPVLAGEGMPYAGLPYLPAKDAGGLDRAHEAERNDRNPAEGDEQPQQQGSAPGEGDDPEPDAPHQLGEEAGDLRRDGAALNDDVDPAYAFYQRMAGWD